MSANKTGEPRIVSATVGPMPKGLFDPMPKVRVLFDDGTEKCLFSFYPDEVMFQSHEFLGMTEADARRLFHRKDVAFLRS